MPATNKSSDSVLELLVAIRCDLQRLEGIEQELKELSERMSGAQIRNFSTEELIDHLKVGGKTKQLKLKNLRKRCSKLNLRPIAGGRGWDAAWSLPRVLAAQTR